MAFAQKLQRLDGRHKLAIVAALVGWAVSMFFSKEGFSLDAQRASWLGWALAVIGTVVELVFNTKTRKLSLTLIIVGILYYMYGIWTNVIGFWDYQHVGIVFQPFTMRSLLPWFVGTILEVLPEPLFMWGLGAELEGDLIGNLVGLWSGNLDYDNPSTSSGKREPAFQSESERVPQRYIPTQHPNQPKKGQGRQEREKQFHFAGQNNGHKQDTKPNYRDRFSGFGE